MAVELEELKQRQDALEEAVRHLDYRLTVDEQQLNSVIHMGPPVTPDDDRDTGGEDTFQGDTQLQGIDSMLRSIGMHQGFHANHLKDVERELKNLLAKQEHLHEFAMVRTERPLAAIQEGIKRVERMITELADRRTR